MIEYNDFQKEILAGIPDELPEVKPYDPNINHAPKRKDILTKAEKKLAIRNALRMASFFSALVRMSLRFGAWLMFGS